MFSFLLLILDPQAAPLILYHLDLPVILDSLLHTQSLSIMITIHQIGND